MLLAREARLQVLRVNQAQIYIDVCGDPRWQACQTPDFEH